MCITAAVSAALVERIDLHIQMIGTEVDYTSDPEQYEKPMQAYATMEAKSPNLVPIQKSRRTNGD